MRSPRPPARPALLAAALLLGAVAPRPARAQVHRELPMIAANAALGAVTAAVTRGARTRDWRQLPGAVVRGAVGGTALFAARRVAATPVPGAGLVARQFGALGSAALRNAGDGRPVLDDVTFPVGPLRVRVARLPGGVDADGLPTRGRRVVRLRADLPTLGFLGYAAASRRPTRLDLGASLAAGAPVLRTDVDPFQGAVNTIWHGTTAAGVVWLREPRRSARPGEPPFDAAADRRAWARILAHEQVHLVQYDAMLAAWSAPLEAELLRPLPGGRQLAGRVDLGLGALAVGGLGGLLPYHRRPWEREAHLLTGTHDHSPPRR